MPKLRNGSKGGFETGLSRLRVRHSTSELLCSTTNEAVKQNIESRLETMSHLCKLHVESAMVKPYQQEAGSLVHDVMHGLVEKGNGRPKRTYRHCRVDRDWDFNMCERG